MHNVGLDSVSASGRVHAAPVQVSGFAQLLLLGPEVRNLESKWVFEEDDDA